MLTNTGTRSAAHPLAASPYISVKTITIDAVMFFIANLICMAMFCLSAKKYQCKSIALGDPLQGLKGKKVWRQGWE
jgi:hypothetical protein